MVVLIDLAASTTNVLADDLMTTDAIAGTWYGNMHFSDRHSVEVHDPRGLRTWKRVCEHVELFRAMCLGKYL